MSHRFAPDFSMTVAEFKDEMDKGTPLVVVDVRHAVAFAASSVVESEHVAVYNAPFSDIMSEVGAKDFVAALKSYTERVFGDRLRDDVTVVAVCTSGNSSVPVTEGLRKLGYRARNLEGGMKAWNTFYDVRSIEVDAATTIFQISRPARGCLSYMVAAGDEAIVIDPLRHESVYMDEARRHGLRIVRVLDTHGHADHISGGPSLATALGVPYHLHPYDAIHPVDVLPSVHSYEPLHDGQLIHFGTAAGSPSAQAALRVLHVPGHTLGQVAFILNDTHAFVGDTVFVESVARPDLGGRGDTWAPIHYESLKRLMELPDDTVFWPGHYSAPSEIDEEGLCRRPLKTLKETNSGLQQLQRGRDEFVRYILANLPEFPPQYVDIKRVNIGLIQPNEDAATILETGRNVCALSDAYNPS